MRRGKEGMNKKPWLETGATSVEITKPSLPRINLTVWTVPLFVAGSACLVIDLIQIWSTLS